MGKRTRSVIFASMLTLTLASCSGGGGTSESAAPYNPGVVPTPVVPTPVTKSVTLNWTPPTTNTDGTALTDLSGYSLFYGTDSRLYFSPVRISDPATTSAVIDGLASGRWYFSIKSINEAGMESDFSGEVQVDL